MPIFAERWEKTLSKGSDVQSEAWLGFTDVLFYCGFLAGKLPNLE